MKKKILSIKQVILFLLCLAMLVGDIGMINASAAASISYEDDGTSDGLDLTKIRASQQTSFDAGEFLGKPDGTIVYIRRHTLASTNVKYHTDHMIFTASPVGLNEVITSGQITRPADVEDDTDKDYGIVTSTYTLSNLDLNSVAESLNIEPVWDNEWGCYTISVYMSHVFRIQADTQAAFDEISNAYKSLHLTQDTSWYKTYNEFFAPGGDSSFWQSGTAGMQSCINIKLTIPANPEVYTEFFTIPINIHFYDSSTKKIIYSKELGLSAFGSQVNFNVLSLRDEGYAIGKTLAGNTLKWFGIFGNKIYTADGKSTLWFGVNKTEDPKSYSSAVGATGKKYWYGNANRYSASESGAYSIQFGYALSSFLSLYVPVKETGGLMTVVYFDESTEEVLYAEDTVETEPGTKDYTASIGLSSTYTKKGYTINEKSSKGYSAYADEETVSSVYGSGTKYSKTTFTQTSATISGKLSRNLYSAIWVPCSKSSDVTIVYFDSETEEKIKEEEGAPAVVTSYCLKP